MKHSRVFKAAFARAAELAEADPGRPVPPELARLIAERQRRRARRLTRRARAPR